jgi:hypothetical protein
MERCSDREWQVRSEFGVIQHHMRDGVRVFSSTRARIARGGLVGRVAWRRTPGAHCQMFATGRKPTSRTSVRRFGQCVRAGRLAPNLVLGEMSPGTIGFGGLDEQRPRLLRRLIGQRVAKLATWIRNIEDNGIALDGAGAMWRRVFRSKAVKPMHDQLTAFRGGLTNEIAQLPRRAHKLLTLTQRKGLGCMATTEGEASCC